MVSTALSTAAMAVNQVPISMGCGIIHDFIGGHKRYSIDSSGHKRAYTVHLPETYNNTEVTPIIVAYHPAHVKTDSWENFIQLTNPDINDGTIVVYPVGIEELWDGPGYSRWEDYDDYQRPNVDDRQFTHDLLDQLSADFCTDISRIYATGHSAGASFGSIIACDEKLSERFAAIAITGTPVYTDLKGDENCNPARSPIPIMAAHFRGDPVAPFLGGQGNGGLVASIPGWMKRWAKRNKCDNSTTIKLRHDVDQTTYDCGGVKNAQRLIAMNGKNHAWPRAQEGLIDFSKKVFEFVSAHSRPGPWGEDES